MGDWNWNAVNVIIGDFIPTNLEKSFLAIVNKAQSEQGWSEIIEVLFFDERERSAGGIQLSYHYRFDVGKLRFLFCADATETIPCNMGLNGRPQLEWVKEWVIFKRGHNTMVYCYGMLMANFTASRETCDDAKYSESWSKYWNRNVHKIKFPLNHSDSGTINWDPYSYYIGM